MTLLTLAASSAWNRRGTLLTTVVAMALSVSLLFGIERLRHSVRDAFSHSVSGTDLIIGSRSSPTQLMLYAVFRVGEPTQGMQFSSYQALAAHPAVAWAVPLALGDSYRGFPVIGTEASYFERFRYGRSQPLQLVQGQVWPALQAGSIDGLFDVVLGAEVAASQQLKLGDTLTLSHGDGAASLQEGSGHDDKPFRVRGILAATGTPVDRSVHIRLEAMQALHLEWQGGAPIAGVTITPEQVRKFDLTPQQITATLVGLKSRTAVFSVQRLVQAYRDEPLMAVLPSPALLQLWDTIGIAEKALQAVSAMVTAVALAGMVAVMLAGLQARRRELAVLRAVGASPGHLTSLLLIEGLALTAISLIVGLALLSLGGWLLGPWIAQHYGLHLSLGWPELQAWRDSGEPSMLLAVLGAGVLAGLIPGLRAYRMSLADGLTPRL